MGEGKGTKLYGIIGHPVAHSLSPNMHNAAFKALGINAVYLAFDVVDLRGAIQGVRALGVKGLSVTVPHKEAVIEFIDVVDQHVRSIGALNTIVNNDGLLYGTNTDWLGAVRAIEEICPIAGKRALVVGAGGSAKAIVYGLTLKGATVHVANRTESRAKELADRFGATFSGLSLSEELSFDILINATTCGMGGDTTMPVSIEVVKKAEVVMDIVYAPLETPLLKTAKALKKTTIDGLKMLLYQAVGQFELWTGKKAPVEVMKNAIYGA
ncbi:Shikimate 5-dehydrogenase I alpha [Dissulfuribacter thermophilus]|uniref:Shikimate dehydrogenase (NADP(+)) n=1 Tax=Dissulfuribacter thermophilus TaxID=1156395 RepID=A0A1B9F8I0_9BACT|nr:shikimate dehydrogenase [Dissulfuribacter thermophilus]OCC16212.1 Shikimate 5-dehydrogenase I alpha [Dissulfuribacter thermophilus]